MGLIIVGGILLFLQVLSYIGNSYAGNVSFFNTFSIYEIVYFLGYNFLALVGILLIVYGIIQMVNKNKQNQDEESNDDKTE